MSIWTSSILIDVNIYLSNDLNRDVHYIRSSFSSSIKASRNNIDREMEFFAINHHLLGFPLSFFCFGVNFLIFLLGFSVSVSSHLQASFKAFVGKTKAKSLSLLDLFVGSRASDNPR